MGKDTTIHWCDSTVNPVMGCDGCELWRPGPGRTDPPKEEQRCYAGTLHLMRGGNPGYADRFLDPKLFAGRVAAAARWPDLAGKARPGRPWLDGLPRLIFVSDMGDALSKSVPFDFLRREIVDVVTGELGRRHAWLWLTKQPGRMAEFSRWLFDEGVTWPANLWAMTSITSSATLGRARQLAGVVGAAVRGLSVEPLVGPVEIGLHLDGISWVIVGGESGPNARRFDLAWARNVVRACDAARIPVFVKQLGSRPVYRVDSDMGDELSSIAIDLADPKGGDMEEWPAPDLRRREFPTAVRPRATPPAPALEAASADSTRAPAATGRAERPGDPLTLWALYQRPRDQPAHAFIARRWVLEGDRAVPTADVLTADDDAQLLALRRRLAAQGLVRLERAPSDDPVIVETWI